MNLDRFTQKAQEAIVAAQRLAEELQSPILDSEHLLAALVEADDGIPAETLRRLGVDVPAFREELAAILGRRARIQGGSLTADKRVSHAIERAGEEARRLRDEYVSTEHLLIAIAEGGGEAQTFFIRLTPDLERLQRMRASYNWISDAHAWPPALMAHYAILFGILLAAFMRLRREMGFELRLFLLGLPIIGMLSLPASWLLLDQWRWALIPQFQPLRCILFVTLFAQFLTAVAGVRAAVRRQPFEAIAWFALAYLPPVQPVMTQPYTFQGAAVVLALALVAWLAIRFGAAREPATLLLGLAAFFAIPGIAGVVNYPHLRTPELDQLSTWARSSTPKDAVFQFADIGKGLDPGIFRAQAVRAVYVDWKGGGQVNYLSGFAEQWWRRWQQTNQNRFKPRDLPKYAALGIRYVVLQPKNRLKGRTPVFESAKYLAYALP